MAECWAKSQLSEPLEFVPPGYATMHIVNDIILASCEYKAWYKVTTNYKQLHPSSNIYYLDRDRTPDQY